MDPATAATDTAVRSAHPRDVLLESGADALHPAELMALVLGTGTPGRRTVGVAGAVLEATGGVHALRRRTPEELSQLPGVGAARAARLLAAIELGRRCLAEPLRRGTPFRSSRDIFRHYHDRLRDLAVEQFLVVLLDGKHRVLRDELVSQGTLTSSLVHPREVFRPAIRHGAAAVVLLHNHPSGDPSPSADDLEITRRLCEVGTLVGIRVLDHVVVGDGAYTSLADRGLLGR